MHEQFLLAALEQARLGMGQCAPNPCVGAVAVQNGAIIAQAYHKGAGTPHAEQLLLAQLPPGLLGVHVYITLEPCNHWGKTPPCVDALVNYGIEEVIFSYFDPNPIVAKNNSSQHLREHGIKVTHLQLQAIDTFYKSYTKWIHTGLPFVTVKMAQSLDGKIGVTQAERLHLSNELCHQFTHKMRFQTDVILTTATTIRADNPKMNVRLEADELKKPIAIIDSDLTLEKNALIFSTAKYCHIYHRKHLVTLENVSFCSYHEVESTDEKGLNLSSILSHLGKLGYHDVWIEAGGKLFSSLHQEELVDRTYLYIVPICLGEKAYSAYQANKLFERKHTLNWQEMGNNMILCMDWQEN